MRILVIDIGTGTQDILLFDSTQEVENCAQLIMPSPTTVVARRIEEATHQGRDVLLTGSLMGGGPSAWAAERHLKAGHAVYATPTAALTFNDDLAEVQKMGVRVVSEDEVSHERDWERIEMRDVYLNAIGQALEILGVPFKIDAVVIAALDHGNSPPGYSDRLFRFDHLRRGVQSGAGLYAFAYLPSELPEYLTRLRAIAHAVGDAWPSLYVDTGVAAALGCLLDEVVARRRSHLLVNIGNMHTLAFVLERGKIGAFMEHHTGFLNGEKLTEFLERFVRGALPHEEVFRDMGHGVLYADGAVLPPRPFVAVTGPRHRMIADSRLRPYFAAPYGDMMLAGCYGAVRAVARKFPHWREEIDAALKR
ncbi:MAG: DUF1786 domain-containing protein [Chloroflexota bacterium]|nr:DUF1786 domain-containing protein [Chloroflexota bacterium]